jgi:hypothetical protein
MGQVWHAEVGRFQGHTWEEEARGEKENKGWQPPSPGTLFSILLFFFFLWYCGLNSGPTP